MERKKDGTLGMPCQICGAPATRFQFAMAICDKLECENEAFEQRGGPGGHKRAKVASSEICDQ